MQGAGGEIARFVCHARRRRSLFVAAARRRRWVRARAEDNTMLLALTWMRLYRRRVKKPSRCSWMGA